MENIEMPKLQGSTEEEIIEKNYKQKQRELKISKARAAVLRCQTTEAYQILENIRFDYLGDTMFRGYYVSAKRELEGALSDYLLSDNYWNERIDKHNKLSSEEYDKKQKDMSAAQGKPSVVS